jgi:diacylglycerol O-acyltransferase / wax synthase
MATPVGPARRMSAMDASFFNLERTGQLLHIAGVYTVEGALDFERLERELGERLHLLPRYTQRVVEVPFGLAHPTWEDDPEFHIRNHVHRHTLRPPGDDEQLSKLASRLFAEPLDRTRPLWELHQIDGYRGDRSVLFGKVHHAMVDGVSGVHLLSVIFDPSPRPASFPPAPAAVPAAPLPSWVAQLVEGVREEVTRSASLLQRFGALVRHPAKLFAELAEAGDALGEMLRLVVAGTPPTPFNGHVSILRRVLWTTFDLNHVKGIKNRLGGTVNDVILATIATALRGYLQEHGVQPDGMELRAMVPVNVRAASEGGALGNRISMMAAPLPVGIHDPLERLRQVRAAMGALKGSGQPARMTRMLEVVELLPPFLQRPLAWLNFQGAPVNTVCTNVPGPPVSLYAQGKRLETLVPIVPLAQGVGLAFAILSYADTITIGVNADPALVPDGDLVVDLLREAHEELRALAGVEQITIRTSPVPPERVRRRTG